MEKKASSKKTPTKKTPAKKTATKKEEIKYSVDNEEFVQNDVVTDEDVAEEPETICEIQEGVEDVVFDETYYAEDAEEVAEPDGVNAEPEAEPEVANKVTEPAANEVPKITVDQLSKIDVADMVSGIKQEDIIVPVVADLERVVEKHKAKPLFPPSKYTKKIIVKRFK